MSRSSIHIGSGIGFLFLLASFAEQIAPARADVAPPPVHTVRAMPSPGCTMKPLSAAVAGRFGAVQKCLHSAYRGLGRLSLRCSFDAEGKVTQCEVVPGKKSEETFFSKHDITCIQKALTAVHIDPKNGDPTKCSAQIEVQSTSREYHRPQQHYREEVPQPVPG